LVNQRALLMRSLRARTQANGESDSVANAGAGDASASGGACATLGNEKVRGSDELAARLMADLLPKVEGATAIESLLGLEGQGASLYFGEFGRFLRPDLPGRGFDFRSRNRRPPKDPVNALLSFAYSLLSKDCFSALCTVGFDPYHGFFH